MKIYVYAFFGVIAIMLLMSSLGVVQAGERGVRVFLGNVRGVEDPGLYFKVPLLEKMVKINARTLTVLYEREEPLAAASKDLQDVQIATVVNYHIDPLQAQQIYVQYKTQDNYEAEVVRPAVRDIVKATASGFTAEELVTKRAEFTALVGTRLNERLQSKYAVVEQVNITNFQFSPSFTQAIEAKVTAEQEALAAKNQLERVKYEAEQRVVQAEAEAEAIRIQAEAVTSQGGEDYVELQRIEKWNGQGCTSYCGLDTSTGLLINR